MGVLEVERVSKRFGGLAAVDELSFRVEEGEIRGLIGPNGAGKTTTFNIISGYYPPTSGQIFYRGQKISGLKASEIARLGLVRTFQSTTLFHEFTVLQNVLVGCHLHAKVGVMGALLGTTREVERRAEDKALEILAFIGLSERKDDLAMNLPHGLQRALGVAVALAADPRLLLLDEPFTGMNPEETRQTMALVEKVRDRGVTLLVVEHDMQAVMGLCEKITVLNFGRLLAEGSPEEIRTNEQVIEAYLGTA
ncbi:MAG: ABC transporter ATP-binding protein [Alphaproteobacteria bacterium]